MGSEKSLCAAYTLWVFFGLCGGHRFYLDNNKAVAMLYTFGGCMFWCIADGFLLPGLVREYNKAFTAPLPHELEQRQMYALGAPSQPGAPPAAYATTIQKQPTAAETPEFLQRWGRTTPTALERAAPQIMQQATDANNAFAARQTQQQLVQDRKIQLTAGGGDRNIIKLQIHWKKELGRGVGGAVFEATILDNKDPLNCACKVITFEGNQSKYDAWRDDNIQEAVRMSKLSHGNIVKFYGIYSQEPPNLCILTEICESKSLDAALKNPKTQAFLKDIRLKRRLAQEIADGLQYLHTSEEKLLHKDLAARNVLLAGTFPNVTAKVSDFGFSASAQQAHSKKDDEKKNRPWRWMAPEILRDFYTDDAGAKYTMAGDVWSLGVTLYELYECSGRVPYTGIGDDDAYLGVMEGNLQLQRPSDTPDADWKVIQHCLTRDPALRTSCRRICSELETLQAAPVDL